MYLNYGIHALFNVVTQSADDPAGILIRALEPVAGIEVMRRRRARGAKGRAPRAASTLSNHLLCSGPGNLTVAMGITLAQNYADLCGDILLP